MNYSIFIFLLGVVFGGIQLANPSHATHKKQATSITWLSEFDGEPLIPVDQTDFERSFQRGFPGSIATFRCGEKQIILRHITSASRKLHPSSDCLRASGHHIGPVHIQTDSQNRQWAGCTATKSGTTYLVLERITDPNGDTWTDASSWYWHALIHPNKGPWLAQTLIRRHP